MEDTWPQNDGDTTVKHNKIETPLSKNVLHVHECAMMILLYVLDAIVTYWKTYQFQTCDTVEF